ncbi:hypothetical protein ABZY03_32520 [Streptomyces klenkii]|uniref:hypothetical protein n=1 Tax=Streptomyces klenkii TaxID=1420899 RepID=UPI0033AF99DB
MENPSAAVPAGDRNNELPLLELLRGGSGMVPCLKEDPELWYSDAAVAQHAARELCETCPLTVP